MDLRPRIFGTPGELFGLLHDEFERLHSTGPLPLVSLASGASFADFYRSLPADSELFAEPMTCTHLDEYEGFGPEQPGGMAWELFESCAPLQRLASEGRFFSYPHRAADLPTHAERIAALGGIELQLLGIGRNGHLAFNEPGGELESVHRSVPLHPWTVADMGQRFAPKAPPTRALSSGLKDILAARRIVLVARGARKAEAVRRMLREPPSVDCPASFLQLHGNLLVLLDREAAGLL